MAIDFIFLDLYSKAMYATRLPRASADLSGGTGRWEHKW